MGSESGFALFDDSHGQPHWSQTGFPSRELGTNFSGIAAAFIQRGVDCRPCSGERLVDCLSGARVLVMPPPTGIYDPNEERWMAAQQCHLTPTEVAAVVQFLDDGGSLLAFGYRFGDSFTACNLNLLFGALGCRINDDAVIDLARLRVDHPLLFHFECAEPCLSSDRLADEVTRVLWRSVATFTIGPTCSAQPIAVSPGGRCISYDRMRRCISCQALPIAVAGTRGRGRFALFGGPHQFETGPYGLLTAADNSCFLGNLIDWLLDGGENPESSQASLAVPSFHAPASEQYRSLLEVHPVGVGAHTVGFLEQLLHESGVLKALARPLWMP